MSVPHSSMRSKRSAAMAPSMTEASAASVLRPMQRCGFRDDDVGVNVDGA